MHATIPISQAVRVENNMQIKPLPLVKAWLTQAAQMQMQTGYICVLLIHKMKMQVQTQMQANKKLHSLHLHC